MLTFDSHDKIPYNNMQVLLIPIVVDRAVLFTLQNECESMMGKHESRNIRHSIKTMSSLDIMITASSIVVGLILLYGLISLSPFPVEIELSVFVAAILILIGCYFCFRARHPQTESEPGDASKNKVPAAEKKIPPMPELPPTITANKHYEPDTKEDGDFEIAPDDTVEDQVDNPPLYRHSFSIAPVIFKLVITTLAWIGLLVASIAQANQIIWAIFGISTPVAMMYCYYIVLRWNGEEFIVNDEWYQRPLTMPMPFTSVTPAIRRTEIGQYRMKQTLIDKVLKTCRLYSNTPVENDEEFHNIKWLTHPAELRRATGISAPRKNSYFFWVRKRKD